MKKLLTILITASLAMAAGAIAQQDEASPSPKKKKQMQGEHHPANEAAPANEAHPAREGRPGNQRPQNRKAMRQERAPANAPAETKNAPAETKDAAQPMATAAPAETTRPHGKNANARKHPGAHAAEADKAANPAPATAQTPAPAAAQANSPANQPPKKMNARAKKPAPEVVQKVKTEHANFKAKPEPAKVPTVTFNESYRINGAQQWQGPQYEVFRTYRPERHDQNWYRSHYSRVEIIAGGAYYFNNGFWFPAWGYNPAYQYYAYDAPIYVGSRAEPPDRVIADVQAILQQEGYYKGEVDGLLGPLTREALVGYQTDNGLYATAVIDEPTLNSLDLG